VNRNILLVFVIKDIKKMALKLRPDVTFFSIQVMWTFFVLKVGWFYLFFKNHPRFRPKDFQKQKYYVMDFNRPLLWKKKEGKFCSSVHFE